MPKQGAIVLVPFPFTNLTAAKVRPALVLSAEPLNEDVIVAFISSKPKQGKYVVGIIPSRENGLKVASVIICSKIATLEKAVVLGELGTLEERFLKQVRANLAAIFAY
ncbi:MAG TPA: type II toxin-antitoxin system PemK/MazF family toxin [Candidatus Paceibacterota bacterium]